jgi:hypothetical protein
MIFNKNFFLKMNKKIWKCQKQFLTLSPKIKLLFQDENKAI